MRFLVIIENLLKRIKKIQRKYLKGIKNLTQKRKKKLSRFQTSFVCCSQVVRDLTNNIVEQRRRHCSEISLTVVKLCVCTKRVCVCNATGFLMPDQSHFLSLYSYSLILGYSLQMHADALASSIECLLY